MKEPHWTRSLSTYWFLANENVVFFTMFFDVNFWGFLFLVDIFSSFLLFSVLLFLFFVDFVLFFCALNIIYFFFFRKRRLILMFRLSFVSQSFVSAWHPICIAVQMEGESNERYEKKYSTIIIYLECIFVSVNECFTKRRSKEHPNNNRQTIRENKKQIFTTENFPLGQLSKHNLMCLRRNR